jgi:hypothetical protein
MLEPERALVQSIAFSEAGLLWSFEKRLSSSGWLSRLFRLGGKIYSAHSGTWPVAKIVLIPFRREDIDIGLDARPATLRERLV